MIGMPLTSDDLQTESWGFDNRNVVAKRTVRVGTEPDATLLGEADDLCLLKKEHKAVEERLCAESLSRD